MINLKKELEKYASNLNEAIEKIVIGNAEYEAPLPKEYVGTPLNWDDVSYLFNYDYEEGYGVGRKPHPFHVYTKSYVIFVSEYDSSYYIEHIPRSPMECTPKFI